MVEINWNPPDKDATYDQVIIYRSNAKYGTYSVVKTIEDIRTTKYNDLDATSSSWWKIRFFDSVNSIYSSYSEPFPATGVVSDTNYTTPRKVIQYVGGFRDLRNQTIGHGDGVTTSFSLPEGDTYIIAETETILVNNSMMKRNIDYVVDYEVGTIDFTSAPADNAVIKASYWSSSYVSNEMLVDAIRRAEEEIDSRLGRTFYQPEQITVYIDAFDPRNSTGLNFIPIGYETQSLDYRPNTYDPLTKRVISLDKFPVIDVNQIIINAQPTKVIGEELGTGDDSTDEFTLSTNPIVYGSEIIYLDDIQTTSYTIDYDTGIVMFNTPPDAGVEITADYTHCKTGTILSAQNYLLRKDEGTIYLKSSSVSLEQNPLICAVTYSHGHYYVPALVEKLATKLAGVDIIQTTQLSTPNALSIQASNIGIILGEIRSVFDALGKKMKVTRI